MSKDVRHFAMATQKQDGVRRYRTICPECPDSVLKSRDSANPYKHWVSRLSRLVPTIFNMYRKKKRCAACVVGGQRI
jgi:hypothetical protein